MQDAWIATYVRDGEWIVGWIEEVPGVMSQGRTLEETRDNLRDALHELIAARRSLAARDAAYPVVAREAFVAG